MARIKIKDLPKGTKISKEELQRIKGGATSTILTPIKWDYKTDQTDINQDSFLKIN